MASTAATVTHRSRPRQATILLAYLAALTANVIHNNFGLDPAIAPATVLLILYWWRPIRPLLWGTALFIALPSFMFLKFTALLSPADTKYFLNHFALSCAAVLSLTAATLSFRRQRI